MRKKKANKQTKKTWIKKRLPLFLAPFLQNTRGRAIDCEQLIFLALSEA